MEARYQLRHSPWCAGRFPRSAWFHCTGCWGCLGQLFTCEVTLLVGEYPDVVTESKLEIQMLHDRLLVRAVPDTSERRSNAGLVIPDTVKLATRMAWGEVCGAGTSVRHVKTGDRVLFDPEEQGEVEINGERYVILRERDVHATANESPDRGTGLYL